MIGGPQIRAARALLGIGQQDLSRLAQVGINTVKRVEQSAEMTGSVRTLWKIQTTLEAAGIEFISAEGGKGPGVRLKEVTGPVLKSKRRRKQSPRITAGPKEV
jgi:transcriptional regulator with XRE-family HTH domain